MRTVGMGLLAMGIFVGLLGQTSSQAAPPGSMGISVGAAVVGHPPGPPGPARHWYHPPVHRPPCVVLPAPPPPPPPPRRVYYGYPPAVYYFHPPVYWYSYESIGRSFYYSTPRTGIVIRW